MHFTYFVRFLRRSFEVLIRRPSFNVTAYVDAGRVHDFRNVELTDITTGVFSRSATAWLLGLILLFSRPAFTTTLAISPTADGNIGISCPDIDFCLAPFVQTTGQFLTASRPSAFTVVSGVLEFDLEAIPADATITSATLHVYSASIISASPELEGKLLFPPFQIVRVHAGDGVIDASDLSGGGPFGFFSPVRVIGADNPFPIPVAALSNPLLTVVLTGGAVTLVGDSYNYYSLDAPNADLHPWLSIEYSSEEASPIPEPSMVWIVAPGLLGVAVRARKTLR